MAAARAEARGVGDRGGAGGAGDHRQSILSNGDAGMLLGKVGKFVTRSLLERRNEEELLQCDPKRSRDSHSRIAVMRRSAAGAAIGAVGDDEGADDDGAGMRTFVVNRQACADDPDAANAKGEDDVGGLGFGTLAGIVNDTIVTARRNDGASP